MEEWCKEWQEAYKEFETMWELLECGQSEKSTDFPIKVGKASQIWAKLKQNLEFVKMVYENVKGPHERRILQLLDRLYELDNSELDKNVSRDSNKAG